MRQQVFGIGPTHVLFTNKVCDGHFHISEPHFIHFRTTIQKHDRTHFDSRCVHVDQQERNALLLLHIYIRAHQAEDHVCVLT